MKSRRKTGFRGFTLIELLVALTVLSLLAVMSYRGLAAILDAQEYVKRETEKWRRVDLFLMRFEHDVQLAIPRPVRTGSGVSPAWLGVIKAASDGGLLPYMEFSRLGSIEEADAARRTAYLLNDKREVELWLWPGLDIGSGAAAMRYSVLAGVAKMQLHYLTANRAWVNAWPSAAPDSPASAVSSVPRAVRLRITLASGEEIERIFQ
ncbi:MAG: type II secretion system protein GspJ [Nitrosomonadales bacterium SCN 54-20]|nr:MAG: type II secretion system protein GspJ [Nitrosomonadales bacterium SCN 54-20]